jgi:hypothetical protein
VCWQALPSHASIVHALPSSAHEVPDGSVGHGSVHVPFAQKVLTQSLPPVHASPSAQRGQVPPPQSTAVSLPSCTPLAHGGSVVVLVELLVEVLVVGTAVVVGAEVAVAAVVDVVVVGVGHRQLASHATPPWQPPLPGGSHCSPLDTTASPHRTSQDVPPSLQQLRQSDEKPRHAPCADRSALRAAFTHWRFAFPVPVHFSLSLWKADLAAPLQALRSAEQLALQGFPAARAGVTWNQDQDPIPIMSAKTEAMRLDPLFGIAGTYITVMEP